MGSLRVCLLANKARAFALCELNADYMDPIGISFLRGDLEIDTAKTPSIWWTLYPSVTPPVHLFYYFSLGGPAAM